MVSVERYHGVRVFQSGEEPILVSFADTSTVGLLMAIDADDLPSTMAFNHLYLIQKPLDAVPYPEEVRDIVDMIYDQAITNIVLNMVEDTGTAATTRANAVGNSVSLTGINAFNKAAGLGLPTPKLLLAPGLTTANATDGIASVSVTAPGTGYSAAATATVTGAGGTGQGAILRPVLGVDGVIDSVVVAKPGFGYVAPVVVTVAANGGGGTGATATGAVGQVLNPIVAEAMGVTDKLEAIFYADGPDGTAQQAIQARMNTGHKRLHWCDPRVLVSREGVPVPSPTSAIYVGQQAAQDKTNGAVWPATNMLVNGIVGTNRPVDPTTEAQLLNFGGVNTVVNHGDGFRTWGGFTAAVGTVWQFVNVVRVHDLANSAIRSAFRAYNGRPMLQAQIDLAVIDGREALYGLENDGFLLPGSGFYFDRDAMGADDGPQGIVKFIMFLEAPAPMVDIRITAKRNMTVAYRLLYDSIRGSFTTVDLNANT